MTFKSKIGPILSRKIISAAISGSVFAVLLGLFIPDPFGLGISSLGEYIQDFVIAVPTYLMFSFPVILLYGIITSLISDYITHFISNYTNKNIRIYLSFSLHIIFGLILFWYSLLASILYFITDFILIKKGIYKWINALKSLAIPILVWVIFMGTVYIINII